MQSPRFILQAALLFLGGAAQRCRCIGYHGSHPLRKREGEEGVILESVTVGTIGRVSVKGYSSEVSGVDTENGSHEIKALRVCLIPLTVLGADG